MLSQPRLLDCVREGLGTRHYYTTLLSCNWIVMTLISFPLYEISLFSKLTVVLRYNEIRDIIHILVVPHPAGL